MTPSRPELDVKKARKRSPALCGLLVLACLFPPNYAFAQPLDQSPGGIPDVVTGQDSPGGEPGVSSPGSMGMDEQGEPAFKAPVDSARKRFGERSKEYMCSLLDLGMYYNRRQRYADALKVLTASLNLADSGVLSKLTPKAVPPQKPAPPQPVTSADGGVVSIAAGPEQPADLQFLQGLLPALIEAEIHQKSYVPAEAHLKRLIAVCHAGGVSDKVALIGAYAQYAELLRKTNRKAEAAKMQKKSDDINSSFVGL